MNTTSKLWAKLKDREYRQAFVRSQITIGIPFQIRALLKSVPWTQEKLATEAGMLQPRISDLLKPGKVRPNIETLRRLAAAFDCGLVVRFVPFTELARWSETFDPETFSVPSFEQEDAQATPHHEDRRVWATQQANVPPSGEWSALEALSETVRHLASNGVPQVAIKADFIDRQSLEQDAVPPARKLPGSENGTMLRGQCYAR